ncbi:rare lipoprotein A [Gammaproteobacteria bacterium]
MNMYYHKFRICRNWSIAGVFIFCLTQLSGCSFVGISHKDIDGAPSVDIDASKIADAVPRSEPYHPYGTRDYVVGGHRYHVLKSSKGYVKTGNASWYGTKFHGNNTSTQERYNLYSMTAASTELPLPSYVQVTNLRNGKQVIVRVNDRGPFHSKRILDLSYAAAKKLDFVDSGTAPVKIVGIDPKTWNKNSQIKYAAATKPAKNGAMYLQVGAFSRLDNAKQLFTKIAKLTDRPTSIKRSDSLYRVHIGPMACATQSNKLKRLLEKNGFNKVVVVTN